MCPVVLTRPVIFSISPNNAEISEDLPAPTCPTTATNDPGLMFRLMFLRVGGSSGDHENEPFSTSIGFTVKNNVPGDRVEFQNSDRLYLLICREKR